MRESEYYKFIIKLCQSSGEVLRRHFLQRDLVVEMKSNDTPVTVADREAESVLREVIAKQYPEHGIIGEEHGNENEGAEHVWTLDPIDGTVSFVSGVPLFGTLIGLLRAGKPILGAIYQPILQQLCVGDGTTTELNESQIRVRECVSLSQAVVSATDIANIEQYQSKVKFDSLVAEAEIFRTWGDCYGYLLLASGKIDVMLDPIVNPWDVLPVIPIVEGAGGTLTTWNGGDPLKGDSCISTAGDIHEKVLGLLN